MINQSVDAGKYGHIVDFGSACQLEHCRSHSLYQSSSRSIRIIRPNVRPQFRESFHDGLSDDAFKCFPADVATADHDDDCFAGEIGSYLQESGDRHTGCTFWQLVM